MRRGAAPARPIRRPSRRNSQETILSLDLYTRFVVALLAILALLAVFAWLVRRYGAGGRTMGGGKRRLSIVEVAPIDGKRRLVLLRRHVTQHLLLLRPHGAPLLESGIAASPPSPPSSPSPSLEPRLPAPIH